jgi:hypothetical protein
VTLLPDDRKITVTVHAMDQYRDRVNDARHWRDIEVEITKQVRCAEEAGNLLSHKPDGFLMYGERRGQLPLGQRFAFCDPEARIGFIIKRFPQETVVVTTLVRVGVHR